MRSTWLGVLLVVAACSAPPSGLGPEPDAEPPLADAAVPDADVVFLGPAIVFDDLHIASNQEEAHALSLLGTLINPQLETAIADGTLLLGIELRDLDDPSGQSDDAISVGMLTLTDDDGDGSDNFVPGAPETFTAGAGFIGDTPAILFDDAAIENGVLTARGVAALDLLGDILPISILEPEIEGTLVPSGDGQKVIELYNGRLRGGLPANLFALLPNIAGDMCPGATMLDVIAGGCGLLPLQPDVDLDDDGLETFFDDDDDGAIDRCVDGDGSEILGTDCYNDGAIADGYRIILAVHGLRAIVVR
jgi:hypothetical protein